MFKFYKFYFLILVSSLIACGNLRSSNDLINVSKQPHSPQNIQAGIGTASIHLGQTSDEIIEHLGKPMNIMVGSTRSNGCYDKSLQWFEKRTDGSLEDGNGIMAYLKRNIVTEIYFSSPKYKTSSGIAFGSLLNDLDSSMKSLPVQILTRSSSEATNGQNQRFVISEKDGVAFEIETADKVSGIYIFEPNTAFQPNGCLGSDQIFLKDES